MKLLKWQIRKYKKLYCIDFIPSVHFESTYHFLTTYGLSEKFFFFTSKIQALLEYRKFVKNNIPKGDKKITVVLSKIKKVKGLEDYDTADVLKTY